MGAVSERLSDPALGPIRRHRLTVDDVLEMARAGFFNGKPRMELIEGDLIEMAPIGPPHASVVSTLARRLNKTLPETVIVWIQSSVLLAEHTLPEPDIALVRAREHGYSITHPGPDDILAVIEVADTSLAYDRGAKAQLFAAAGVPVYWVFDVNTRRVLAFHGPSASGYAEEVALGTDAVLTAESIPGWSLPVRDVFPNP